MSKEIKKSFAFISYNHRDVKWAKWLRRKLEWYRLPSDICNDVEASRYIRPVFRDRDELNSGFLGKEIKERLENSKFLIVICSPDSAGSDWVNEEVRTFIEIGRVEYIIPFFIGEYDNSCLPPALAGWNQNTKDASLIGVAVNDDGTLNRQKAFIRIVSRMLGVSFDSLWKRRSREIRRIAVVCSVGIASLFFLSYWYMTPIELTVECRGQEVNSLPTINRALLFFNGGEYPIVKTDTSVTFEKLPGYLRLKKMAINFVPDRFYEPQNLTITVSCFPRQKEQMQLKRDSTFAVFSGYVYDGDAIDIFSSPLSGADVTIGEKYVRTDSCGHFELVFPLSEQTEYKMINISRNGYKGYSRVDEVPCTDLKYVLHRIYQ